MRILWVNIVLAFGCFAFTRVGAGDFSNIVNGDSINKEFKSYYNQVASKHFNASINYLYTGLGYGSQRVEREGLSKYLRELSNKHWEEGIDMLKKYFKRGGSTIDLYNDDFFSFKGTNELDMSLEATKDMRFSYLNTLTTLHSDSQDFTRITNKAHEIAIKSTDFHDADWGHYLEEKIEDEEKRTRELKGYITNLREMYKSSLAVHIFDSYL